MYNSTELCTVLSMVLYTLMPVPASDTVTAHESLLPSDPHGSICLQLLRVDPLILRELTAPVAQGNQPGGGRRVTGCCGCGQWVWLPGQSKQLVEGVCAHVGVTSTHSYEVLLQTLRNGSVYNFL